MVDAAKLRAAMAKKGATGASMAAILGQKSRSFYRKLKRGKFPCGEIGKMADYLQPDRPEEIFFLRRR